jgi:hypothetical protein
MAQNLPRRQRTLLLKLRRQPFPRQMPHFKGVKLMSRTIAIWVIALCYLGQTVAVYGPDQDGGGSIFFGNFGYQFDNEVTQ